MVYPTDVIHYRSLLLGKSKHRDSQNLNIVFPDETPATHRTIEHL